MVEYTLLKVIESVYGEHKRQKVGGKYKSIQSARKNAMKYGGKEGAIYILGGKGTPTAWGSDSTGSVYWNNVRWEYVSYVGKTANVHYYIGENGELINKRKLRK